MIYFLIIGLLLIILLIAIASVFFPITTEEKIEYIQSLEPYKYKRNDYSKFDF